MYNPQVLNCDSCFLLIIDAYPYLHVIRARNQSNWPLKTTDIPLKLKQFFETEETYNTWIKKVANHMFVVFGDEHLQSVAILQVNIWSRAKNC